MRCRVCGREFSPSGFQVVVPGLGQGFDRVECALEASALGLPAIAPPAATGAIVAPVAVAAGAATGAPPAVAAASGEAGRAPLLVGANLALLAAGTAATVYLWLRVFGADPTSLVLPADSAAPPFERSTIPAAIDLTPAATPRPRPEGSVRSGGSRSATEPATAPPAPAPVSPAPGAGDDDGGPVLVANPPPATPKPPGSGPGLQPSPLPPPPAPPEEPERPRGSPRPDKPGKPDDRAPGGGGSGGGGGHGAPQGPGGSMEPDKPAKPQKPGHGKKHENPHGKGNGKKTGHGKHH